MQTNWRTAFTGGLVLFLNAFRGEVKGKKSRSWRVISQNAESVRVLQILDTKKHKSTIDPCHSQPLAPVTQSVFIPLLMRRKQVTQHSEKPSELSARLGIHGSHEVFKYSLRPLRRTLFVQSAAGGQKETWQRKLQLQQQPPHRPKPPKRRC